YALYLRHLPLDPAVWPAADPARAAWAGRALGAYPVLLTWVNDSFAFFGGAGWGRRQPAPAGGPGGAERGGLAGLVGTGRLGARAAWAGRALVAYPVLLTWVNDSFAFFGGRRWGRRKLAPAVSPGKTVEGALAGLVGTALLGAVYAGLVFQRWLGLPIGVLAGIGGAVVISLIAQLGDLAESLIKREAGVKDSGRIFPGHGGILDRFDALFFSIPATYWYLALVLRPGGSPWL